MVDQAKENWQRLGSVEDLKKRDLQQLKVGRTLIALPIATASSGRSQAVAIMPAGR